MGKVERLCVDCKWMRDPGEFARCLAPQNTRVEVDPGGMNATGFKDETRTRTYQRFTFCATQRYGWRIEAILFNVCGPQGRWWTPRA